MPFTISHAAAVLPLYRIARLPLTALVIGSMSPDFAYFLPGDFTRLATHSLAGLFWFCWPMGLALWLLFAWWVERPTLSLLPDEWRRRIAPSREIFTPRAITLGSAAVLTGAATHVVWDSFTHWRTPVTAAFPALRKVMVHIGDYALPLYHLLQHASSLIGMVVLLIWIWRIPRRALVAEPVPALGGIGTRQRITAMAFAAGIAGVFAVTNYLLYLQVPFERRLFHFAIAGMTGAAFAWFLLAAWVRLRRSS